MGPILFSPLFCLFSFGKCHSWLYAWNFLQSPELIKSILTGITLVICSKAISNQVLDLTLNIHLLPTPCLV